MEKKYVVVVLSVFLVLVGMGLFSNVPVVFAVSAPCVDSLDNCPENGCAAEDTSDALSNSLKRRLINIDQTKRVTFIIMQKLQGVADDLVGQNHFLNQDDRDLLKEMVVNGKKYSEVDAVRLSGYIVGKTHANKGESVNCRLTGVKNNDFHITLGEAAESEGDDSGAEGIRSNDLEYQGVVVEMIPQHRLKNWTIKQLEQIRTDKKKVLVVGQLFYDSKHKVNDDPEHPLGGQPKRMSLWEIHPVMKFYVCDKTGGACSDSKIEDWQELK